MLADILSPVTPEAFFSTSYGIAPLHIPSSPGKFSCSMTWEWLNAQLNTSSLWRSQERLQILIDGQPVAPENYSSVVTEHHGKTDLSLPDPQRVIEIMRGGASLVINDADLLEPAINAILCDFETALETEIRADLYCTWKGHDAFALRFQASDVFVVHFEGESTWRLYQGQFADPVDHHEFQMANQNLSDATPEAIMPEAIMEVTLRPGDVLYLPRGVRHDMTASSDGAIFVAFGARAATGVDYLTDLYKWVLLDPQFRADIPRLGASGGDKAFADHIRNLAHRLGDIAADAQIMARFRETQQPERFISKGFRLPGDVTSLRYRVARDGCKLVRYGDYWVLNGNNGAVQIPPDHHDAVDWVMAHDSFTRAEFDAALSGHAPGERDRILATLEAMELVVTA